MNYDVSLQYNIEAYSNGLALLIKIQEYFISEVEESSRIDKTGRIKRGRKELLWAGQKRLVSMHLENIDLESEWMASNSRNSPVGRVEEPKRIVSRTQFSLDNVGIFDDVCSSLALFGLVLGH